MPFLLATPVAEAAVATTARVAIPKLVKYLAKNGGDKLIKKYGQNAFEAVLGTTAGVAAYNKTAEKVSGYVDSIGKDTESTSSIPKGSMEGVDRMKQMSNMMAVPNINPNINKNDSNEEDTVDSNQLTTNQNKDSEPPLNEPPKGPNLGKELATEAVTQATKKLLENKKPDLSKQTKDLVPEKPKFGKLTKVEKQTALALKGDKPDFYSRAVEAITNAKQDKSTKGKWKSIIQSNSTKTEMDYLGLNEILQGNESITKQELLDIVSKKDITPGITVKSIPRSEMNIMYADYSLGGNEDTKGNLTDEHIVFQLGKDQGEVGQLYVEPHFPTEYATNTFAHARTQVGYNFNSLTTDPDGFYKNLSNILNNTLIIDEIQSSMLQQIQTEGSAKEWKILKGSDINSEFIKKNYGDIYKLREEKFRTQSDILDKKDASINKVLYATDKTTGITSVIKKLDPDKYYTFSKNMIRNYSSDSIEEAKKTMMTSGEALPDFPIRESKKWVELVLNKMIEKASLEGRDSIAITNGQIQANRYDAMTDEDKEGLKKFYDTIVYDQLNKIAKEYGVELETIDMENPDDIEGGSEKEELSSTRRKVKSAQDEGYVLQKVPVEILQELTNNVSVPGHASFYSSTGKGQGVDYILNNIDQEYREAVGMGDVTTEYYIWSKEPITLDIQKIENLEEEFKKIVWELPIVPTKDASENEVVKSITNLSTLERDSIFKQFHIGGADTYPYDGENLNNIDLIQYTEYLQNYKPPEGVNLGYEGEAEQLIKMPLPKRLQKDSLSKPIKLSKLETQTNKMLT
tara:strand:- start:21 stop:2420 length:2400 start_codon:yes stop_codon:yes gene_type:complete